VAGPNVLFLTSIASNHREFFQSSYYKYFNGKKEKKLDCNTIWAKSWLASYMSGAEEKPDIIILHAMSDDKDNNNDYQSLKKQLPDIDIHLFVSGNNKQNQKMFQALKSPVENTVEVEPALVNNLQVETAPIYSDFAFKLMIGSGIISTGLVVASIALLITMTAPLSVTGALLATGGIAAAVSIGIFAERYGSGSQETSFESAPKIK
jgi:hypothetical protein